uniref:(California timema) hypothetical protein n=1 Tax=Timema californicum TaxID=61474 RepID=A0A7R9JA07_TIMCA|nr:unnamed protein product [Timema californicum]
MSYSENSYKRVTNEEKPPPVHLSEIRTSISPSSAVELNTTRAENGEALNESPSESDRMDISDVSDQMSPVSEHNQSPTDRVDNHDGSTTRLDNAAAIVTTDTTMTTTTTTTTTTTNSTTTSRGRLDSVLSLDGLDLELPTLDAYQEEYVDFPSSPKQLKERLEADGVEIPLEVDSGNNGQSDEEEDTSIYQAVLSPNCRGVRLRKERLSECMETTLEIVDHYLGEEDEDDDEDGGGDNLPAIEIFVLDELSPNYAGTQDKHETSSSTSGKKSVEPVDCSFVFDRRDSKRLARKELGERVMEGLFIESRQTEGSLTPGLKKISAPDHLQSIDSPVAEHSDNMDDSFKRATDSSEEVNKSSVEENNNEHNTAFAASSEEESAHPDLKSRGPVLILDPARLDLSLARWTPRLRADGSVDVPQERPSPVTSSQRCGRRKIQVSDDIYTAQEEDNLSSVSGAESPLSDMDLVDDPDLDDLLSHELDSPDDMEDSILERLGDAPPPIPELSAAEEMAEARSWRNCVVAGQERHIDMKVIEPYKRVLSHGGYLSAGSHNAIIVFSACYLPDRSRVDYDYVMDNLFLYVLTTLDELITDDYVLVYLHGATSRGCMPTFSWLKRCYQMIDRRLRKNLKGLYLVHPTFWLKTIVVMTRPFISSKFSRKLSFVETLGELGEILPLEQASIPDRVKQ